MPKPLWQKDMATDRSLIKARTLALCECSLSSYRLDGRDHLKTRMEFAPFAAANLVSVGRLSNANEAWKNIVFFSKSDFLLEIKGRKWAVNSECIAISLRHCHKLLKITDDSIIAFITGHSAAVLPLMKCADFLCTMPIICVLSLWPLQASRQLEVSAAALPSALSEHRSKCPSQPSPVKVKIGDARSVVLIFYYRLCIGLIFGLIPTDWLWKWEQAHNVHHNRLKCQWSNGAKMLIYQLNVLFPLVRGGHVSHCVIIAAWRSTEMLLIFGN